MALKVKLSRQPIRRVMMLFPLGLLVTSVVFDFGYIVTRRTVIAAVADWTIAAGVIAGLLAAPLSWLTWSGIQGACLVARCRTGIAARLICKQLVLET